MSYRIERNEWFPCLAVKDASTPTMGNTKWEQARVQKVWNNLLMRAFLQKGDISLRPQHAYYTLLPHLGCIKTRWILLLKTRAEGTFLFNDN